MYISKYFTYTLFFLFSVKIILRTTLEISALWCALMCYPCKYYTHVKSALLLSSVDVILLNELNQSIHTQKHLFCLNL